MAGPDEIDPVRLCCMQRHAGVVCPDGKVMCCLCFERVSTDELHVENGSRVNVCKPCGAAENVIFPLPK